MKLALVSALALSLTLPAIAQDATAALNQQVLETMRSQLATQTTTQQEDITDLVASPMISSNEQKHIHVVEVQTLPDDRITLENPGGIHGSSKETGDIPFGTEHVEMMINQAGECKHHSRKHASHHGAEPQSVLDDPDMAGGDSVSVKALISKHDGALDSLSLSLTADVLTVATLEDGTRRFIAHTSDDPSKGYIIELREFSEKQ